MTIRNPDLMGGGLGCPVKPGLRYSASSRRFPRSAPQPKTMCTLWSNSASRLFVPVPAAMRAPPITPTTTSRWQIRSRNCRTCCRWKNGKKVKSAKMWTKQRRPEIVEDFDREVLGRVPKNVPKVTWTVTQTVHEKVGAYPVIGKQLVGAHRQLFLPGDQRRHSVGSGHS